MNAIIELVFPEGLGKALPTPTMDKSYLRLEI